MLRACGNQATSLGRRDEPQEQRLLGLHSCGAQALAMVPIGTCKGNNGSSCQPPSPQQTNMRITSNNMLRARGDLAADLQLDDPQGDRLIRLRSYGAQALAMVQLEG